MQVSLLLLIAVGSAGVARGQTPDAFVESVRGIAWVRDTANAEPHRLKDKTSLFSGQRVNCSRNCKELTISYCNRTIPVPVPNRNAWKLIVGINCNSAKGVRAGVAKGESPSILSPKEGERLQVGRFRLKWKPPRMPAPAQLSLKIYLGETIWGPEKVDTERGWYESSSLTRALSKAQTSGQLVLVFSLDDGKQVQNVKFYLISVDDQKNLAMDLRSFDSETNEIVKAVGRGSALAKYELYSQAAKEFFKAMEFARRSKSRQLTMVTLESLVIQANYMAYNDDLVKQMCSSWTFRASPLPEACALIQ